MVIDSEDQMLKMWGESMKDVNCKTALINYEDFVLLMKGQKRDRDSRFLRASLKGLAAVPEFPSEDEIEDSAPPVHITPINSFNEKESSPVPAAPMPKYSPAESPEFTGGSPSRPSSAGMSKSFIRMGSNSAPATPIHFGKRFDEIEQADSPLSMDDEDGTGRVSFSEQVFKMPDLDLTPPQTPVRGPADYVTPASSRTTLDPKLLSILGPPDLSTLPGSNALHSSIVRGRSVSLDEKDKDTWKEDFDRRKSAMFKRDSRRAMAIPEHTHTDSDIDRVIADKAKTPLVVNRKLYRAHREFRHAVTEACKRFEDEQMRRAKETLRAQENATTKHAAGLVMRHGQALSEQSIKNFLKKTMEEQQKQVDQANRRGGRGRRSRKKTISDMSGMLAGSAEPSPTVDARKTVQEKPTQKALEPVSENDNLLRNPTKPGEFRKTNYNPFQRKTISFEMNGGIKVSGAVRADEMPSTPPLASSA